MNSIAELALAACRATLEWANAPGDHGGNPYGKAHVKAAERAVAAAEGREPEDWAKGREHWAALRGDAKGGK